MTREAESILDCAFNVLVEFQEHTGLNVLHHENNNDAFFWEMHPAMLDELVKAQPNSFDHESFAMGGPSTLMSYNIEENINLPPDTLRFGVHAEAKLKAAK